MKKLLGVSFALLATVAYASGPTLPQFGQDASGSTRNLYVLDPVTTQWINWGSFTTPGDAWTPSGVRVPNNAATSPLFFVNGDSINPQPCGAAGALTCQPGSDSNNGLSNAAPFLTVGKAVSTILNNYDGLGTEIVVSLAQGSSVNYGGWACSSHVVGGFVDIRVQGITSNATAVNIISPNGGIGASVRDQCVIIFDSVTFSDQGSSLQGLYVSQQGEVDLKNVHFATFNSSAQHISIDKGGIVNSISGGITIDGGAGSFIKIRSGVFSPATTNGAPVGTTITVSTPSTFTKLVDASGASILQNFSSGTFVGAATPSVIGIKAVFAGPAYLQGGAAACNSIFPGSSPCQFSQGAASDGGDNSSLYIGNNLSDVASASVARTNLGVSATGADTTYAFRANNLSDLASASVARINLSSPDTFALLGTQQTFTQPQTVSTSTNAPLTSTTSNAAAAFPIATTAASSSTNTSSFVLQLQTTAALRGAVNFIGSFSNVTDASRTGKLLVNIPTAGSNYTQLQFNQGQLTTSGPSPSINSCGTGAPSVSGNDWNGTITTGTGAPTTCIINFANTWPVVPECVVSDNSTTSLTDVAAVSQASLSVGFSVGLTSGKVYYICQAHQ